MKIRHSGINNSCKTYNVSIYLATGKGVEYAGGFYITDIKGSYHFKVTNATSCDLCNFQFFPTVSCNGQTVSTSLIENPQNTSARVKELSNEIKLYPTLTNSNIKIESNSVTIKWVKIYDSNGSEVAFFQNLNLGTTEYNLENLPNGVYICQIITENDETVSYRIVKQ